MRPIKCHFDVIGCGEGDICKNTELQQRREAAVARGIGHVTQRHAVRALNAEIWDADGKSYIDFVGGIGVLNTGHRHPKVMAAIEKQMDCFVHTCVQVMPCKPYVALAEKLNAKAPISGDAKIIFCQYRCRALENAVKIARAYTKRPGVIAFSGGFHGRTLLGMALTGKVMPYKTGFGPFPADIYHARFPHAYHGVSVQDTLDDIAHLFKYNIEAARVAAFIIEPVQGEGGFTVAPPEFMFALRKLCDEYGILLIADEVQSGVARSGKLFAKEHYDVHADINTVAKSIGGGLPLAGVVGRAEVIDAPAPAALGGLTAAVRWLARWHWQYWMQLNRKISCNDRKLLASEFAILLPSYKKISAWELVKFVVFAE